MKTLIITLISLAVFCSMYTHAQVSLSVATEFEQSAEISDDRFQEILKLTEEALNNYAIVGRIYDTSDRRVNSESIKAFNNLFTPAAEVVKDYVEFPPRELVDFRDYSIEVFNMLSDKGVEFLLSEAELKEIRVRKLGNSTFYMPVVKVTKTLYAYLDRYGALKQSASGNAMELLITFDIYDEDLSSAKIAKINHGVSIKPADDYNRIIGVYATAGSSIFSPTFSNQWSELHADNDMDIKGGINWGVGVDIMTDQFITPKSHPNRKLGLSAGLRFSSVTLEANVPEFTTSGTSQTITFDGTELQGQRSVSTGNMSQTLTINTFSIPIGLDYKLVKTRTMILAIHGRMVPSFLLGANSTLSGTLLHDVYFPEYDLLYSDPNSGAENWGSEADAGSRTFEVESNPEVQSFVLGFELSPTAYFNFEDTKNGWGILVGADIGFVPRSFIAHEPIENPASEPLTLSSELPTLTTAYVSDLSSLFFGIRIGLFHRNVTQP